MYDELCKAWKSEVEKTELEKLSADFYPRITEYMKKLREEGRMLDRKTTKTNLLKKERLNSTAMVERLIQMRYRKIVTRMARGEAISQDVMTPEEREIYSKISPFSEVVHSFAQEILRGQTLKTKIEAEHNRTVLRFLKEIPAIIGSDIKTYGPFKVEDLASMPKENGRILVKQSLAEKLEIN